MEKHLRVKGDDAGMGTLEQRLIIALCVDLLDEIELAKTFCINQRHIDKWLKLLSMPQSDPETEFVMCKGTYNICKIQPKLLIRQRAHLSLIHI